MKVALIMTVAVTFTISCFTSAYESKAGVPKNSQ